MNSSEYGPSHLIETDWISPSHLHIHCLDTKIIRMRSLCFVWFFLQSLSGSMMLLRLQFLIEDMFCMIYHPNHP